MVLHVAALADEIGYHPVFLSLLQVFKCVMRSVPPYEARNPAELPTWRSHVCLAGSCRLPLSQKTLALFRSKPIADMHTQLLRTLNAANAGNHDQHSADHNPQPHRPACGPPPRRGLMVDEPGVVPLFETDPVPRDHSLIESKPRL